MGDKEVTKRPIPLAYRITQCVFFLFYKVLYRFSYEGIENIPHEGGVIVAPNHASLFDPPAVGCIVPRKMTFLAKRELFSVPGIKQLLQISDSIPIDRGGFTKGTIVEVVQRLKRGESFIIFPEGTRTRTGEFGSPKKGIGMVAVMADVPVVPCLIEGSFRAKPFLSKIAITFLPPINPSECISQTKKDNYLLVSEKIMCDIINLFKSHHGRA